MVNCIQTSDEYTLFYPMPPASPEEMQKMHALRWVEWDSDEFEGDEETTATAVPESLPWALVRLFPDRAERWWKAGPSSDNRNPDPIRMHAAVRGERIRFDNAGLIPETLAGMLCLAAGISVAGPSPAARNLLFSMALADKQRLSQYRLTVGRTYGTPLEVSQLSAAGRYEEFKQRLAALDADPGISLVFSLESTALVPVFGDMYFEMPWNFPPKFRFGLDDQSRMCLSPVAGLLDHFAGIRETLIRLKDAAPPKNHG